MAKTAEEKREYRREYYARNREKILERNKETNRAWQKANPEKVKERARAWREKNPEKAKETTRAWREKNPEKVKEANQKYYYKNREKILARQKEQRRRKKDEKNAVVHGTLCGDDPGGVLGGLGSGGDEPVGAAGVCAADGAAAADLLEPGQRGGDTP